MMAPVPPILWYLLAVVAFGIFPLSMVWVLHRQKMTALEILRSYAERGIEPPQVVTDLLLKQLSSSGQPWRSTPRGSLLHTFGVHLFTACVLGGIAWWRVDAGLPRWSIYVAVGSTLFFAALATGQLAAALKSPLK
jgi:hypothetical protein